MSALRFIILRQLEGKWNKMSILCVVEEVFFQNEINANRIAVLSDQDAEDNLTSKTLSDTQRILPTAGILCNTWSKAKVEIKSI